MPESLVLNAGLEPIAGYRLVRLLGRGGFGEVWEARAPGGFHVAMKFLRVDTREGGVEQRALEVIRNIRNGHLLDIQFATRVADCLVIAMPLCDQSLLDRLNACRAEGKPGVPRNELLRYMDELARAVDYLNEPRHPAEDGSLVGIQHRDIKPHNIFLVGGSVRLADFGLAKILAATVASTQGSMSPSYATPEVIQGQFSRWSDQYSMAATYCELRTGRPPFEGDSAIQIIYAHVHRVPDLLGFPAEERAVVARALAKQPEQRWPTCRAFVHALITAAREDARRASAPAGTPAGPSVVGATKLPETQMPPPVPPTRVADEDSSRVAAGAMGGRRRAGLAGLAVVIVLLVAVVVIPRLGPSGERTPREIPPATETTIPPGDLVAVKPPDPPLSRPWPSNGDEVKTEPDTRSETASVPPKPEPAVPVEPPKPITSDSPPIAVVLSPAPVEPPNQITSAIGMKLVLIPAGEFLMGSPNTEKDADDDEKPQHRVRITRPFYLGATEVTQGQYRAVMGQSPSYFKGSDDLPVEQVSWGDATAFCNKLSEQEGLEPYYHSKPGVQSGWDGYRLPTEAEWEYACRGGSTTRYGFGDDVASLGEYAWYDGNSGNKTHPVGGKRPNAFNLYNMQGNVWEWCQDWYDKDYYGRSADVDPPGPAQAAVRVIRGGGWYGYPLNARSADRVISSPAARIRGMGFRVARA